MIKIQKKQLEYFVVKKIYISYYYVSAYMIFFWPAHIGMPRRAPCCTAPTNFQHNPMPWYWNPWLEVWSKQWKQWNAYQSSNTELFSRSFTIWSSDNWARDPDKSIFLEKFVSCISQCIPHSCNLNNHQMVQNHHLYIETLHQLNKLDIISVIWKP